MSLPVNVPIKLDLEECFQNGPPFQYNLMNNENYILICDNLLKTFGKTSRQAVEFSEMFSKAARAVTDSVEALGRFEAQNGEDENGIISKLENKLVVLLISFISSII